MKKIATAALAATMTLSIGAVEAKAASNTMNGNSCLIQLDGERAKPVQRAYVRNHPDFKKFTEENVEFLRTSSNLGEALGSSDADITKGANNAEAVKACIDGVNYQSKALTDGEKAGIIAGTVIAGLIALGSVAWPFIQPMVQQYLPF